MKEEIGKPRILESHEIYEAIDLQTNTWQAPGGLLVIERDYGNSLPYIERFVKEIGESDAAGFLRVNEQFGLVSFRALPLGRKYFCWMNSFIAIYSPDYAYSEHVEVFFRACIHLGLEGEISRQPQDLTALPNTYAADLFNDLVYLIRAEVHSERFRRKVAAREANSKRNYLSCVKYVDALFELHSRLLVLRVDFSYTAVHGPHLTVEEVQKDLARYLASMRSNQLFKTVAGYIWKLEYTPRKGLHLHLIFFLNGAQSIKDAWIADRFGQHWQEMVESGEGLYHNCNVNKQTYARLGIGMISHDNVEKRCVLHDVVIAYLAKKDQYLMLKVTKKARTMGRGEMPQGRAGAMLGRPRRVMQLQGTAP